MSSSIPPGIPENATVEQLRHFVNYWQTEAKAYHSRCNEQGNYIAKMHEQIAALQAENERLRVAVEWYKQADRLICWNGTEWEVRHELKEGR